MYDDGRMYNFQRSFWSTKRMVTTWWQSSMLAPSTMNLHANSHYHPYPNYISWVTVLHAGKQRKPAVEDSSMMAGSNQNLRCRVDETHRYYTLRARIRSDLHPPTLAESTINDIESYHLELYTNPIANNVTLAYRHHWECLDNHMEEW